MNSELRNLFDKNNIITKKITLINNVRIVETDNEKLVIKKRNTALEEIFNYANLYKKWNTNEKGFFSRFSKQILELRELTYERNRIISLVKSENTEDIINKLFDNFYNYNKITALSKNNFINTVLEFLPNSEKLEFLQKINTYYKSLTPNQKEQLIEKVGDETISTLLNEFNKNIIVGNIKVQFTKEEFKSFLLEYKRNFKFINDVLDITTTLDFIEQTGKKVGLDIDDISEQKYQLIRTAVLNNKITPEFLSTLSNSNTSIEMLSYILKEDGFSKKIKYSIIHSIQNEAIKSQLVRDYSIPEEYRNLIKYKS